VASASDQISRGSHQLAEGSSEQAGSLGEIAGQVNRVGVVIREIATASEQQNDGVARINGAVEQMNSVTQAVAAKQPGKCGRGGRAEQSGRARAPAGGWLRRRRGHGTRSRSETRAAGARRQWR
jgi:methyl-accepting chemotaxis protein